MNGGHEDEAGRAEGGEAGGEAGGVPGDAAGKKRAVRSRFKPALEAGMRLEERDRELLCDLFWQRAMSRSQLQRLYFTSLVRANARLRLLFDHGFVTRYFLPAAPYGAQAVYSLGKAAVPTVARTLELEEDEVKRGCRFSGTPTFLEHTLSVVEVRLALQEAARQAPDLEFDLWVPEPLCRHEYEVEPVGGLGAWRKEVFKPDGFARLLRKRDGAYLSFFLEADLGHTSSRQFAGKVAMHGKYLRQGLFRQIYGTDTFETLVVTTGPRRVANLLALCREMGNERFRFTTFRDVQESGILSMIWHTANSSTPVGLLPVLDEGSDL